jgi:hypothetical protein
LSSTIVHSPLFSSSRTVFLAGKNEHLSFKTMHAEEVCNKNEDIQILVWAQELRRTTSILIPLKTITKDISLLGCDAVSSGDYKTL